MAATRKDIKSILWKPEMIEGAIMDGVGIPFCPTTAKELPAEIITYEEAKALLRRRAPGDPAFKSEAFVCFCVDDYKFDTPRGIWSSNLEALSILRHFKGIITPDFSTYADFPLAYRFFNTYRMRAFGFWCAKNGLEVINNVCGRFDEDFWYCLNGIELNSMVAIGTVGSGLKILENRPDFEHWLDALVKRLMPKAILVYGSANYPFFKKLKEKGIQIVAYQSKTAKAFERRKRK